MWENAKVAPSSLPANRSTPRSHLVVPRPPVGSSRQTIRSPTPKGQTLIRRSERPSTLRLRTRLNHWFPREPWSIVPLRRPTAPERSDRPGTPSPVPLSIHPGARRRRSDQQWPGPGRGFVRVVRRPARRHSVVPPGLDTRVPVAEPLVPRGASVVAVLPEHVSGAYPGSRPSVLDRSLSSGSVWLVGSPVRDPLAVFGVEAWCPLCVPGSTGNGVFPNSGGDFHRCSRGLHRIIHRRGRILIRWRPQVTRMAPAKSAPSAASEPRAPVTPRSATLRVAEWIAAAAPESPTRRSFTRRTVR